MWSFDIQFVFLECFGPVKMIFSPHIYCLSCTMPVGETLHNSVSLEKREKKSTSWQILLIAVEAFQLLHNRRNNSQIKVETFCIQVPVEGILLESWRIKLLMSPLTNYSKHLFIQVFFSAYACCSMSRKPDHIHIFTDLYIHTCNTHVFIHEVHPDSHMQLSLDKILIKPHVAKRLYWLTKKHNEL